MFARRSLMKDRRHTYKSIRKFLGNNDYRQDLMEVGEGAGAGVDKGGSVSNDVIY